MQPGAHSLGVGIRALPTATFRAGPPEGLETRYAPERTFWHLLFPLDATEEWYQQDAEGNWTVVHQAYDQAFLGQIEGNWQRYVEHSGGRGQPFIPLPASTQHAIEHRLFDIGLDEAVQLTTQDLERTGNIWWMQLHTEDAGPTPGLWALIEWTPDAMAGIRDGKWMCLSPTTARNFSAWADLTLPGESVVAVGLVDIGFIPTLGTARDGLPPDAFPEAATADAVMRRHATRRLAPVGSSPPPDVRQGAPIDTPPAPPATEPTTMKLTDEQIASLRNALSGALSDSLGAVVRSGTMDWLREDLEYVIKAMVKEMTLTPEVDALVAQIEAQIGAIAAEKVRSAFAVASMVRNADGEGGEGGDTGGAGEPADSDAPPADEPPADPADGDDNGETDDVDDDDTPPVDGEGEGDDSDDDSTDDDEDEDVDDGAEVARIARKQRRAAVRAAASKASTEASDLLSNRRLAARDFERFVQHRAAGRHEEADALIADYSGAATAPGAPARGGQAAPDTSAPSSCPTVRMSDLVAKAEADHPGNDAAQVRAIKAAIRDAEQAGQTVTDD